MAARGMVTGAKRVVVACSTPPRQPKIIKRCHAAADSVRAVDLLVTELGISFEGGRATPRDRTRLSCRSAGGDRGKLVGRRTCRSSK